MAYGNNLFQSYMPQGQIYQQPNYYQQVPQYYQQQSVGNNYQSPSVSNGLNGKIVESEDMVRIQEIPLGGYGIYPKADMSSIYIKTWNNDGTTRIINYVPIIESNGEITKDKTDYENAFNELKDSISRLENKLDELIS